MPPKFGGGGSMCKRCNKTVYQAEEKKDPKGGYWHSSCFTCKNCPNNNKSTRLDSTNINIHEDEIYCKGCYGALFGPKGYGFGGGAGALTRTQ
ncbi:cysteine and glycine-rich protein 1-like [Acropora palmata]|uniref:cysteine and glycine-rich protein 1-like n=1 Tax=Acropora palmata TaxID=6131 RepID=UPI003DA17A96